MSEYSLLRITRESVVALLDHEVEKGPAIEIGIEFLPTESMRAVLGKLTRAVPPGLKLVEGQKVPAEMTGSVERLNGVEVMGAQLTDLAGHTRYKLGVLVTA